jgi:hypothetical protein
MDLHVTVFCLGKAKRISWRMATPEIMTIKLPSEAYVCARETWSWKN